MVLKCAPSALYQPHLLIFAEAEHRNRAIFNHGMVAQLMQVGVRYHCDRLSS